MIIEEKTYLFKKEFCSMLGISHNQADNRQEELLKWLAHFYDFEILRGAPIKIKINQVIKEYQSLPRKYEAQGEKNKLELEENEKRKRKHKVLRRRKKEILF